MTTDTKALIAEAREVATSPCVDEFYRYSSDLIRRLADALEQATKPWQETTPKPPGPAFSSETDY